MIDFHCHLDLYPDPYSIAAECAAQNIYVLSVTNTPSAWTGSSRLGRGSHRIWTALGLHPQIAHERKGELPLFENLLPNTRYVGEVGLDGMQEFRRYWPDQIMVFARILEACARAGGRILSIHSRRAATQVLDALEAQPDAGVPILHWFSGSNRELERAVELGCWFSVSLSMLSGTKGRELVKKMPHNRVLTESDGPFAQVDRRTALPSDTGRTSNALAEVWDKPEKMVRNQMFINMCYLWQTKWGSEVTTRHTIG